MLPKSHDSPKGPFRGAEQVSAVTCMMTGHLQKLANDLADFALLGADCPARKKFSPFLNLGILFSFSTGLASAAAAVRLGWVSVTRR